MYNLRIVVLQINKGEKKMEKTIKIALACFIGGFIGLMVGSQFDLPRVVGILIR